MRPNRSMTRATSASAWPPSRDVGGERLGLGAGLAGAVERLLRAASAERW